MQQHANSRCAYYLIMPKKHLQTAILSLETDGYCAVLEAFKIVQLRKTKNNNFPLGLIKFY